MTFQPGIVESILILAEDFQRLDVELARRKARVSELLLHVPIRICDDCLAICLPRRLWDLIPVDQRPHGIFRRYGANGKCFQHRVKERKVKGLVRSRNKTLSRSELERLRKAVGLNPGKEAS